MSPALALITIILSGLITYGIRLSFIVLLGRVETPPALQNALRFVPPAVLAAIIIPEMLMADGALNLSLSNLRLIAGLVAIVVAWRTRNAILTVIVGMGVLWGLQFLTGLL